jgi:hypothetical protein
MSWHIIGEAMSLVTWWGLRDRVLRRSGPVAQRQVRRPSGGDEPPAADGSATGPAASEQANAAPGDAPAPLAPEPADPPAGVAEPDAETAANTT